ncbi:hypothetical protein GOP47_0011521 [Adiantum capillus-veneris]|uniref:Uncharacterized protein n=1 Tax=Adiantum capillus-veneris TaxID=13818 RepID=A0A9D4ZFH4_ADICA|nr:hypothetical protein GOP47_0011521 [Adiantum capillus-veneris]
MPFWSCAPAGFRTVTHGRSRDTCGGPGHHKPVVEHGIDPRRRCAANSGSIAGWVDWCVHVAAHRAAP